MECPNYKCDLGDSGGRYKTPAMEAEMALQLLTLHNQHHNQNAAVNQSPTSKKPPKYPRPEIGLEETPERWEAFVAAWGQYKLEYDLLQEITHGIPSRGIGGIQKLSMFPQLKIKN